MGMAWSELAASPPARKSGGTDVRRGWPQASVDPVRRRTFRQPTLTLPICGTQCKVRLRDISLGGERTARNTPPNQRPSPDLWCAIESLKRDCSVPQPEGPRRQSVPTGGLRYPPDEGRPSLGDPCRQSQRLFLLGLLITLSLEPNPSDRDDLRARPRHRLCRRLYHVLDLRLRDAAPRRGMGKAAFANTLVSVAAGVGAVCFGAVVGKSRVARVADVRFRLAPFRHGLSDVRSGGRSWSRLCRS